MADLGNCVVKETGTVTLGPDPPFTSDYVYNPASLPMTGGLSDTYHYPVSGVDFTTGATGTESVAQTYKWSDTLLGTAYAGIGGTSISFVVANQKPPVQGGYDFTTTVVGPVNYKAESDESYTP